MSEYVTIPGYTPIAAPQLPASSVAPSLFQPQIPGVNWYPTQYESMQNSFAGELRGFYAANKWKPAWSKFGHLRGGNQPPGHGGVDVFAPSGTPIVSPIDGEATMVSSADGNDLGNRVHVAFTFNGVPYRFMLGHFSSFNGASRSVVKGEVIGYAGCTGNAGGNQPCQAPNNCGKYSTHVHLSLWRWVGSPLMPMDPLPALGWSLRYQDDTRDILCSQL